MSGRLEAALRNEKRCYEILKDLPEYVADYYHVLSASKEQTTCIAYLGIIRNYLGQISDNVKEFPLDGFNEKNLSQIMRFSSLKITNVTGEVRETTSAYRRFVWFVFNSLCKYLLKTKRIEGNPMELVEIPSYQDEIKRVKVTAEDIKKLIDGIEKIKGKTILFKKRMKAMVILMANTGMRISALLQIDLSDIDWGQKTLTIIDKRHKTLTYNITDIMMRGLLEWLEVRKTICHDDVDALFITSNGTRLLKKDAYAGFRSCSKEILNKSLSPHKLRAAFCTILYDKTKDIKFVQEAVGHTTITVTQRYIVSDGKSREKASGIMADLLS